MKTTIDYVGGCFLLKHRMQAAVCLKDKPLPIINEGKMGSVDINNCFTYNDYTFKKLFFVRI